MITQQASAQEQESANSLPAPFINNVIVNVMGPGSLVRLAVMEKLQPGLPSVPRSAFTMLPADLVQLRDTLDAVLTQMEKLHKERN